MMSQAVIIHVGPQMSFYHYFDIVIGTYVPVCDSRVTYSLYDDLLLPL